MPLCPACGRENPDEFTYCGYCTAPLGADADRVERKVVTVLFADLVGSTASADARDPEDVRAAVRPKLERIRAELERYGGTFEKYVGDAVMAVFGAPRAHEDDPERAVRAALAIRDGIGGVRVAVNTGEAVVALSAARGADEGIATGDVVNTTFRIEEAAAPEAVLVGERTFKTTRHVVEYRELPSVDAKGKPAPIRVWEAVAFAPPSERRRAALVGRHRELTAVVDAFERCRADRTPQLVTISGVPGIGKSRLVEEFAGTLDRERDVTWRHGRSLSYGDGVNFWALGEIVKAEAGILENDDAKTSESKLRAAVERALGSEDLDWVTRHLRRLVGQSEPGSEAERDESFAAWRRFLEAIAEERPLVLAFEDLHWADDGLLDFVDYVAEWATGVPIFVLATARPELLERRPAWGGGKAHALTVSLAPLSSEETAELLGRLGRDRELDVSPELLDRTGGIPLYAEEYVRSLAERGDDATLPETLEGLIAGRIDALPPNEKDLLQDAAVIGKVFWPGALERAPGEASAALHSLERKQFVRRERTSAIEGETQYAFHHALIRDVAYGQLTRPRRADKHFRAGRWIAGLGREDDHAEMLAHHYSSALELGASDPQLADNARAAWRAAGDRAQALNAFVPAADFYARALELVPPENERAGLLFQLGSTLLVLGDPDAGDRLTAARDGFLAADEQERAAQAAASLAWFYVSTGENTKARASIEHAFELVRDGNASSAKARVLARHANFLLLWDGLPTEAAKAGQEAAAMADELGLDSVKAEVLLTIGLAEHALGKPTAIESLEAGRTLAERAGVPGQLARAYLNLAYTADETDYRRTTDFHERGLEVASRYGLVQQHWTFRGQLAGSYYFIGRWDEAISHADAVIAAAESGGLWQLEATRGHVYRALMRVARGDVDGALDDVERTLDSRTESPRLVPYLAAAALVLLQAGHRDKAADTIDRVLRTGAQRPGAADRWFGDAACVLSGLGRPDVLTALVQDWNLPESFSIETGRAWLRGDPVAAADIFDRLSNSADAAYARLRAGEQLLAQGRPADAAAQLQRALEFYRRVAATRFVEEAERMLVATRVSMTTTAASG